MQVSDYNMVSTGSAEEMNVHRPIRVNSYLLDLLLVILFWKKYSFLETCGSNIFHRSDSCSDPIYPTGRIPAQIQYILQVRFLLISIYDFWLHFWYLQTFPLSDHWLSHTYTFFPLFIHVLFTVWLLSVDDHMTSKTLYVSDMLRHKWLLASCCTE
jgi:hypothetical protein